jgi:hypothetical protein
VTPLEREDFITRQVKVLAAMLARIAGLRLEGNLDEARAELARARATALGAQAELLLRVDSHTAASMLGSTEGILALGRLLREEAALEDAAAAQERADPAAHGDRAASLRLRAAELGIEAVRRSPESREAQEFLREGARDVDQDRLSAADRHAMEAALAAAPAADARPDLTGTWRFDPARSRLQISAPDSTEFVLEHRDPRLHLTRTHVFGGKRDVVALDLTTDGKETALKLGGVTLRARAHWEGRTLVFDSTVSRGGEEGTNVVRYTMADDGASLAAEEQFRSASLSYDNLWVLERVPAAG